MKISFAEPDLPRLRCRGGRGVGREGVDARRQTARRGGGRRHHPCARRRIAVQRQEGRVPADSGNANLSVSRILLAGLGKLNSIDTRSLQELGGKLFANLTGLERRKRLLPSRSVRVPRSAQPQAAAELAFGAQLRSYRFDKYKTKQKPEQKPSLAKLTIGVGRCGRGTEGAYQPLEEDGGGGVLNSRPRCRAAECHLPRDPRGSGRRAGEVRS